MADADDIKKKLKELRSRLLKSQESLDKMKQTSIPADPAKKKTRKNPGTTEKR